ncbi:hypothetical protein RUND412_009401, partial [Rhizina undulata]
MSTAPFSSIEKIQWCRGIMGACQQVCARPGFDSRLNQEQHGAAEARRAHNPE